jgi:TetR/AcrR family transcriptional regulator, cholesterol catabolism regulator
MVIRSSDPHTHTRKEQIYETASTLFSANGYRSTSVRDIARELDLQGGSLYAHITSKEQVLWEIVSRVATSFDETVRPIATVDAPARERLRRMIHAHVDVIVCHLTHAAVFFRDWRHLSEPRRLEVLALRDSYEALFRQVIAGGIAAGEFAPRNPRLAATFILTALNGIPGWYRPDGEQPSTEIADAFADMLMTGLVPATDAEGIRKGSSI